MHPPGKEADLARGPLASFGCHVPAELAAPAVRSGVPLLRCHAAVCWVTSATLGTQIVTGHTRSSSGILLVGSTPNFGDILA